MYVSPSDMSWLMNVDTFINEFDKMHVERRAALVEKRDAAEGAAKVAFEKYKESKSNDDMREYTHQRGIARDCRAQLDELHEAHKRFYDAFCIAFKAVDREDD